MVAENAGVDRVHLLEFVHVKQKDAAPQNMLQAGAGGFQDRFDISQTLLGLRRGIRPCKLTGRRVCRALTGDENETFEPHPGRVRSDRLRQILCVNGSMSHERHFKQVQNS
jgi:hypothetical protein